MFANALKSISSTPITSGYTISSTVTSTAGPWKIYSAKKKSTGKECSVFVFDKKSLDAHTSGLSRSSASAFKKVVDEVVERLKKEASSLAKFRHPGILEIIEPVEETRGGGLQFVTEAVTASLSSVLQDKDEQERHGGVGGRSSRYVTEDANGTRRRRELEIDELEIQKGLLQVSKALEFLHDNANLVHGNLTPDAVLINAKSDWKISGFSFCSPPDSVEKNPSWPHISLSEVLHLDSRLPRTVQLNLDYTSPDFVLDNNLNPSADMFSLGLLCVALYNSPHRSPLECNSSISAYKRHFQTSQGVPTSSNNFLCSRQMPKELERYVLPRLITRRPAQRMTAKEFQNSEYFDNILISTIRFLDGFPAKTPNEKSQFLRGLIKVLPSFPKAVMEKKVLPALLEELKDRELISLILHNVFKIIELLPSGKRAFSEPVRPKLKEIFVTNAKQPQEKDSARDAGLMIVLEQLPVIVENCSGKEFKDDILPIVFVCLESPTPTLVDGALRSLNTVLPVLDFSTIKHELFPVVAMIFSKTNSLAIKVRGLQAFVTLCGGSNDPGSDDGLDGFGTDKKKTSSSTALDKFTMQEKIVPLIKVIKTKEPAVMMAALNVLKVVGKIADADFVAMDILPILWSMSLGPLLDLKQFQAFMDLIKTLSRRVEDEQIRKLQELGGGSAAPALPNDDFMSFSAIAGSSLDATNGTTEDDFERLVKGNSTGGGGGAAAASGNPLEAGWEHMGASPGIKSPGLGAGRSTTPTFSWSTPEPAPRPAPSNQFATVKAQQAGGGFRTVTPDLGRIEALSPTTTQFSQPLQPTSTNISPAVTTPAASSLNWGAGTAAASNPWASSTPSISQAPPTSAFGNLSLGGHQQSRQTLSSSSSFSLPPPPNGTTAVPSSSGGFSLAPPPGSASSHQQPQRPQIPNSLSSFGGVRSLGGSSAGLGGVGVSMGGMMKNNNMGSTNNGVGMGMGMMMSNNSNNVMGGGGGMSTGSLMGQVQVQQQQQQQKKPNTPQQQGSGLDKYASLL